MKTSQNGECQRPSANTHDLPRCEASQLSGTVGVSSAQMDAVQGCPDNHLLPVRSPTDAARNVTAILGRKPEAREG